MRCSLVSGKLTNPLWRSTIHLVQNLGTLLQQCRCELHILVEAPAGGGALGRDISRQRWERCFNPRQELSSMNFLAASAFEERTQSTSVGVKPMTRCRWNCTGDIGLNFSKFDAGWPSSKSVYRRPSRAVLGWMSAHPRGTLMSVRTLHAETSHALRIAGCEGDLCCLE